MTVVLPRPSQSSRAMRTARGWPRHWLHRTPKIGIWRLLRATSVSEISVSTASIWRRTAVGRDKILVVPMLKQTSVVGVTPHPRRRASLASVDMAPDLIDDRASAVRSQEAARLRAARLAAGTGTMNSTASGLRMVENHRCPCRQGDRETGLRIGRARWSIRRSSPSLKDLSPSPINLAPTLPVERVGSYNIARRRCAPSERPSTASEVPVITARSSAALCRCASYRGSWLPGGTARGSRPSRRGGTARLVVPPSR